MSSLSLADAVEIWLERYKDSSREINAHRIGRFLEFVAPSIPLTDVDVIDILRYQQGLKAYRFIHKGKETPYSQKTLRMHMLCVKIFFNWCQKKELLKKSPARLMEAPAEPIDETRDKVMEEDDLQIILAFTKPNPLKSAFVHFSYESACRTGEVCSLRISNLNLDKPLVWIDPNNGTKILYYTTIVSGKTGPREVSFYSDTAKALRRWLIMRPVLEHDYVFVTRTGKPYTANQAKQVMRRIREGIKKHLGHTVKVGNIQSMRKRMGHVMGDANTPQTRIQNKLGHKRSETTLVYIPKDTASAFGQAGNFTVEPKLPDNGTDKISLLKAVNNR